MTVTETAAIEPALSKMKDKQNTRQHHVPQFYLRAWSDDGNSIWVYPSSGCDPFRTSTRNVACERGLYRNPTSDKVLPGTTDKMMTRIEGIYSSVWPGFVDRASDERTRRNVARFVAFMWVRQPSRKTGIRDLHDKLRSVAMQMKPEDKLGIISDHQRAACTAEDVLQKAGDDDETVTSAFLRYMPDLIEDISEVLCERRWGVVFSDAPAFLISDYPVILSRGTSQQAICGFRTPGTQVFFPICPTRLLVIDDDWEHDFAHYKLTDSDVFNAVLSRGALRFVFSYARVDRMAEKIRDWRATA